MFRSPKIAEYGFQGIFQHLAPLREGRLHYPDEQRLIASERPGSVAAQADDRTLDLGRRIENMLVHREKVLNIIPRLQQHAQDAVIAAAGRLRQSNGHLFLYHAHAFGHQVTVFEYLEEYLRQNI